MRDRKDRLPRQVVFCYNELNSNIGGSMMQFALYLYNNNRIR